MSRAMERIKKNREKNTKENDNNKRDKNNPIFKSARIKNMVAILEEQMSKKEKAEDNEGKVDNNTNEEKKIDDNNLYDVKIVNKKKKAKINFEE